MKYLLILLLAMFANDLAFGQTKNDNPVNFSGDWVLSVPESQFGKLMPGKDACKEMVVIQNQDSITVTRTFIDDQSKDFKVIETLGFGAPPKESALFGSGTTTKSVTLTWIDNNRSIVINSIYKVNDGMQWTYNRKDTWTLSGDRNKLTCSRVTVLPDRTETVVAVYFNH